MIQDPSFLQNNEYPGKIIKKEIDILYIPRVLDGTWDYSRLIKTIFDYYRDYPGLFLTILVL